MFFSPVTFVIYPRRSHSSLQSSVGYGRISPASPECRWNANWFGLKQRERNNAPVSRQGALSSTDLFTVVAWPRVRKRAAGRIQRLSSEQSALITPRTEYVSKASGSYVTFDIPCHHCTHKSVDTTALNADQPCWLANAASVRKYQRNGPSSPRYERYLLPL